MTDYAQIQKWWEIVMSAYLLVSLHSQKLHKVEDKGIHDSTEPVVSKFREHPWWDFGQGWKNLLNNLRLVMQPYQFFNLLKPWRMVFPITHLSVGFFTLIALMNRMRGAIPYPTEYDSFLFSSA